jgi:hypothetical protein
MDTPNAWYQGTMFKSGEIISTELYAHAPNVNKNKYEV